MIFEDLFYTWFENDIAIITNVQICILHTYERLTNIGKPEIPCIRTVSYTHLTLPTILLV